MSIDKLWIPCVGLKFVRYSKNICVDIAVFFTKPEPEIVANNKKYFSLEMPGIEPGAFHLQSERATTALHPLLVYLWQK